MPSASGMQIAFLLFALEFSSMLATRALVPALGWPPDEVELLGRLISFSIAAAILSGHPGLRRYCVAQLRVPVPAGSLPGLVAVTLAKVAVPFAVLGAIAIPAFATGGQEQLAGRFPGIDPVRAWEWILSLHGFVRTFLVSWIVGPVIEELVFRGLLYRAFERRWGWLASLALTSLLFGLVHPTHMVSAGLGSVFLICVLRTTGSLRACIIVHAAFNVLVSWPLFGQLYTAAPAGDPARLSTWAPHLACLVFVSVALPACIWAARREVGAPGDR